jgi:hypothetical protein
VKSELLILCWCEPDSSDRNLAKVAELLGITVKLVTLQPGCQARQVADLLPPGEKKPLAASSRTLGELLPCLLCEESGNQSRNRVLEGAACLFVYGFQPGALHDQVLAYLTNGRLTGVSPLPGKGLPYAVGAQTRDICRQFAGLTLGQAEPGNDSVFVGGTSASHCRNLISIGGRPYMAHVDLGGCNLILAASREVADIDCPVGQEKTALKWFSQLLPAMMFLRWAFGDACWHNHHPSACFILDDPPLWPTYGFLDFQKLAGSMDRLNFTTSVAFIPWNYRRSHPESVDLFKRHASHYSLCVHGCNHTRGEFGAKDFGRLAWKTRVAKQRMQALSQTTGLPFDNVMVFPQGVFSIQALRALKASGFLAAVNTEPHPIEGSNTRLRLRDLLGLALGGNTGFPLFRRRHPAELTALAFDLFLGSPLFLVGHPEDFKDGYDHLERCVTQLNGLAVNLVWRSPEESCVRACWERTREDGCKLILFCSDRFRLLNSAESCQRYELRKLESGEFIPNGVTVNGTRVRYSLADGLLTAELSLGPGQEAEVAIAYHHLEPPPVAYFPGFLETPRVWLRRHLCELRDNHLRRSSLFVKAERAVRNSPLCVLVAYARSLID